MFFSVRHSADEQELFNPDCTLSLLVSSIRKRCYFPQRASIGLADDDHNVIELSDNSLENAAHLFTDRAVYVLVAIQRREERPPKYTPLLDDVDQELAAKLESLSNPAKEKAPSSRVTGRKKLSKTSSLPVSQKSRKTNTASKLRERHK